LMSAADPPVAPRAKRKRVEEEPSGAKKKKRKPHLGRKEREKLRKAAAAAQAAADEEAGRFAAGGAAGDADAAVGADAVGDTDGKAKHRSRYTVFVGNLPYDATTQDVFKHFDASLRGMVLDVRMNHDKGTGEFRGTCFVDFKDAVALSKAFKLHHSKLLERKINVEATVGGGGKGENRMHKLEERQRELEKLRKKRLQREKENPKTKKTRGLGAQKRSAMAAHSGGRRTGGGGQGAGGRGGAHTAAGAREKIRGSASGSESQ
jgi:nucleolar protein 6